MSVSLIGKNEYQQGKTFRAKEAVRKYGKGNYSSYVRHEKEKDKQSNPNVTNPYVQRNEQYAQNVQTAKKNREKAEVAYSGIKGKVTTNMNLAQSQKGSALTGVERMAVFNNTGDNAYKLYSNLQNAKKQEEMAISSAYYNAMDNLQHINYLA